MSTEHPITPPLELICKWRDQWIDGAAEDEGQGLDSGPSFAVHIATQAARWGADQELEACCEWLNSENRVDYAAMLHADRRPKPPSLAEQAETALLHLIHAAAPQMDTNEPAHYIRTALKRLQQLELENHD